MAIADFLYSYSKPFGENDGGQVMEDDKKKKVKLPLSSRISDTPITEAPTTGASPNASIAPASGGGALSAPKKSPVSDVLSQIKSDAGKRPASPSIGLAEVPALETTSRMVPEALPERAVLDNSAPVRGNETVMQAGPYNDAQNAIARIAPKKWEQLRPYADAANEGDPIARKEYDYINNNSTGSRWKSILQTALAGASQGIAQTGTGWGALGGALGGGVLGGINPIQAAATRYELGQQPRDEASLQRQVMLRKQQMDHMLAQQKILNEQAQAGHLNAQTNEIGQNMAIKNRTWNKPFEIGGTVQQMGLDGKPVVVMGPDGKPQLATSVLNQRETTAGSNLRTAAQIESQQTLGHLNQAGQNARTAAQIKSHEGIAVMQQRGEDARLALRLQNNLDKTGIASPEDIQKALERYTALSKKNDPSSAVEREWMGSFLRMNGVNIGSAGGSIPPPPADNQAAPTPKPAPKAGGKSAAPPKAHVVSDADVMDLSREWKMDPREVIKKLTNMGGQYAGTQYR